MGFSVIDIGSNSVRYMDKTGEKRLMTTRLAEGLVETGELSGASMAKSLAAIGEFARLSRQEGLTPCAYATSAVRDAKNASVFIQAVFEKYGIRIDVLSGEQEAEYARLGANASGGGLVDIGGGSSQVSFDGFRASFPMGCVRAKDILRGAATLEEREEILNVACGGIFRFPRVYPERWTGVGGTITTLAALSLGLNGYDKAAVNACILTRETVEGLAAALDAAGDDQRSGHPLLTDRHDVIVPGALILLFIMRGMDIAKLRVSDADGMEGYLKYLLGKKNKLVKTSR